MSAPAKGVFPGRPKRKIEKKKAKFKHSLHRKEFEDLKLTCSFITNISHQFHRIFDDENDQDIEFVGFSSEECGLQAYKKVSRRKSSSYVVSPSHSDILCSHQTHNKEQVTTRSSHARESLSSPEKEYTSPKRSSFVFNNRDTESSSGSSDSAFLKYNDFKLDFHRLSKKAKNRDEISAEDQANRKDTSVASLKYASEIYLAKHQDVTQNATRSPIKPATFILPSNSSKKFYAAMSGSASLLIKKASKLKEMYDLKKGAGHPHTLAKALLARANRQNRKNSSDSSSNKPRASKTFVLPTKSTRSSRIIKANRKYLDQDSTKTANSKSNEGKECVVEVPRLPTQSDLEQENQMVIRRLKNNVHKTSPRKPLIKEPTFYANDNKIWNDQLGSNPKKPKYKLPSFNEPICIDDSNSDDTYHNQKQFIKQATFMGPKKNQVDVLDNFGLESVEIKSLLKPNFLKWNLGKTEHQIPNWTIQEIHNILHGVHTFGKFVEYSSGWSSIARQYEFHELHRDWKSVKEKSQDCARAGLMNSEQKIENLIFAKLNPKLSSNPNITVFTPQELEEREMTCNITYDLTKIESLNKKDTHVKKRDKPDKDLYLGIGFKEFHALLKPRKPPVQKWSSWEIHNILHGVHYFGLYNWHKIMKLYRFKPGRDAVVLRGRLKAACCRGLFKDGKLSLGVFAKLYPLLKKQGKSYFSKHNISVHGHSSSLDSEDNFSSSSPHKSKKGRLKQSSFSQSGSDLSSQNIVFDDSLSTPVLRALEDGLRRNETPNSPNKNQTDTTSGLSSSNTIITPPRTASNNELATDVIISPTAQPDEGKIRKTSKDETPVSTAKSKGKGPRIKHVCRRASLVTGQSQATYEDHTPHLSALPKGEREKVIAQSEKEKVQISKFTSSESEMESKVSQKTLVVNHHIRKERAKKKAASLLSRCKNCEACLAPPCGDCEACKSTKENEESPDQLCLKLSICTNPQPENNNKKIKRVLPEQQIGSRKSSRLQQQRVPLKSSRVNDIAVTSCSMLANPMASLIASSNFNQSMAHYLKNNSHISMLSPTSQNRAFQDFKARQAVIRIDNWKETYDFDLLWKTGGRALITSHPPPPRITCFLCGSFYLSGVQDTTMVYCSCCCEPFHHYCVGIKSSSVRKYLDSKTWICQRCQYCRVCGHTKNLLECKRCKKAYHSECLGPSYPTVPSESNVWICMQCVRCQSCGTSKPGTLPGSTWTHDFTMCQRCGDLFDKGNYCPICQRCYSDEDYDTRMVQCAGCKRWVHSKCENLSVEMYTLLSYMPDNVQYKCPDCDSRGQKLNAILEDSLNEEDEDKTDQQPDAEKIRSILSELPPPKWKKLMENEIQSGLEAITMSLFHNRAIFCVLKKNGSNMDTFTSSPLHCPSPIHHQDPDGTKKLRSQDLFAVRFAVHNRKYQSVGAFCSDVRTILDTVSDQSDRIAVERAFLEEASSVFSWFNFETGRVRDTDDMPEDLLPNATMPPLPEHDYAQWQDKDITICPGTPTQSPMKSFGAITPLKSDSPFKGTEDLRQCLMCNNYGDDFPRMCGRLLYCGQDEWCHVNCALWSAEVYEQHDGSLQNVHSAASRGRMMRCDDCRLPGATLGCNTRDCPKSFHFKCARQVGCAFLENKQVFCPKHRGHAKNKLVANSEFEVLRLVCIDNDEMRPNRRWQRGVSAGSVTVTIGALTVHQLGGLGVSSDTKECLLPVSYRMTRVFWSTFSVARKAIYTITITERKPSHENNGKEEKLNEEDYHLTISHNSDEVFSKMTPKSSRKKSEDPHTPYRSNLLSKMEESESHIGPLSPRGSSGKRNSSVEGGRYTIMSSLNKTLPQQVTPHLLSPDATQNSHIPSSDAVKTSKVSPGNPFLNSNLPQRRAESEKDLKETKPVFRNTALQNSNFDSPPTNTEHLPSKISTNLLEKNQHDFCEQKPAPDEKVTPTIADSQRIKILPDSQSKDINISPCNTVLPIADQKNIAATNYNSELLKDQLTFDSLDKPTVPLQCGSSGSFIQPIKQFNTAEKLTNVETKNEIQSLMPALPNIVTSTLQNNLEEPQSLVDLKKETQSDSILSEISYEGVKSEFKIFEGKLDTKNDVNNAVQKSEVLSFNDFDDKKVESDCKPIDNSPSPSVVNLLLSAKLAHQTEISKQMKSTPQADPTSGLWWKKGNNFPKIEKKVKKIGNAKEKESTTTKRGRSRDEDFVLPRSADPHWKRRPGEMKSDVATRAITRQGIDLLGKSEEKVVSGEKVEDVVKENSETLNMSGSKDFREDGNSLGVDEIAEKDCTGNSASGTDESVEEIMGDKPNLKDIKESCNQNQSPVNNKLNINSDGIVNKNNVCIENTTVNGDSKLSFTVNETVQDQKLLPETDKNIAQNEILALENGEDEYKTEAVKTLPLEGQYDNRIVAENTNEALLKRTKKLSAYALPALNQKTNNDSEIGVKGETLDDLKREDVKSRNFEVLDLNLAGVDSVNDDSLSNYSTSTTGEPSVSCEKSMNSDEAIVFRDDVSTLSTESEGKKRKEKTKLRKFSFGLDETKRVTRSSRMRSKSHDVAVATLKKIDAEKDLQPMVSLTKIGIDAGKKEATSGNAGEKIGRGGLHLPEDDTSSRRYPRRNTYTCLKSFSGLSPNYALASYSRMQEQERRGKLKQKDLRKKLKSVKDLDKKVPHFNTAIKIDSQLENKYVDSANKDENKFYDVADEKSKTGEDFQLSNHTEKGKSLNSEDVVSVTTSETTLVHVGTLSSVPTNQIVDNENGNLDETNTKEFVSSSNKACDSVETIDTVVNAPDVNGKILKENLENLKSKSFHETEDSQIDKITDCKTLSSKQNDEENQSTTELFVNTPRDEKPNKKDPDTNTNVKNQDSSDLKKCDLSVVEKCENKDMEFDISQNNRLKPDKNELDGQEEQINGQEPGQNSDRVTSEPTSSKPQKLVSCTPLFRANSETVQQPVVDRSVELSSPFKSTEDLSILDELESMNESVEIFRGGSPENGDGMPDLNQSMPILSSSPLEECFRLTSCDDREDLTAPSEMDIGEPNDAALESMKNDASFHTANECPVLNADEVKTLLEDPVTNKTQYNYEQQNLPRQPAAIDFVSPISPNPVNNNMNYGPAPKMFVQQQVFQAPYRVGLPVMNPPNVAQIPQYRQIPDNQNMMYNMPHHHGMSGSVLSPVSPGYVMPNQPQIYQPVNPPIMITNPVHCGALGTDIPYSVHVTMAMADPVNQSFPISNTTKPSVPKNSNQRAGNVNQKFVPQKPDFISPGSLSNKQSITRPRQFTPQSTLPRNNGRLNKVKSSGSGLNTQLKMQQQNLAQQLKTQNVQPNQQQQNIPVLQQQQKPEVSQKQPPISNKPKENSEQEAALESLIDFYSTKNNLNANERAVVRSIIKSQIQTKQLPMPSAECSSDLTVKKTTTAKKTSSDKNKSTSESRVAKRRIVSQDNQKKKPKVAKKNNKKNDLDIMKENKIEYLSAENHKENESSDSCSVLVDVYNNRKKLALIEKKPLSQIMSAYNVHLGEHKATINKENRIPPLPTGSKEEGRKLVYEIKSDDGYLEKGTDLDELVRQLFTAVQECHSSAKGTTPTIVLNQVMTPAMFIGVSHDAVRYLVEQLPGARNCHRYRAKYHKHKKAKTEITHINPHGCCRAEQYKGRSKPDMFSFLASKHRPPPEFQPERSQDDTLSLLSNKRATSMEQLPMAMRFRHLRTFSHEAVGVFRSSIHGRGLFCKRDFEAGEMIMEYTGQKIRRLLTDKREKYYESKQIGCYMFRMDDHYVVDATILGNGARFINHSCEPNCYSRIVNIEGNKHIVIFALRKLYRGEELTYDYKFPIEDEAQKITCNCGARLCRKFMN